MGGLDVSIVRLSYVLHGSYRESCKLRHLVKRGRQFLLVVLAEISA